MVHNLDLERGLVIVLLIARWVPLMASLYWSSIRTTFFTQ